MHVVKTHGPASVEQTKQEKNPKKHKPTPVHVVVDKNGSVLEVVSGPDVVLPERVNGRKARWISVGHDPMCHLLFSEESHKIKVRKRGENFGGATMELHKGQRLDKDKPKKRPHSKKDKR